MQFLRFFAIRLPIAFMFHFLLTLLSETRRRRKQ